ncbi:hypothetical protein BGW36DRAFT_375276 [Talaromyces proteolyticus]|uniref:Uncharacterized protein n=1 Tax=Talaromyces proteolyticus TaxID=1131652 RepID=A0AAD4KVV9_9EURO|nr:uncharacterized protein BGW36DRAFT_375276 [Talaromyces proteolyticus]KAH8700945.1 hypothetical protein BGW36DRAFT_375276 [Talaromyces proteolyticus]
MAPHLNCVGRYHNIKLFFALLESCFVWHIWVGIFALISLFIFLTEVMDISILLPLHLRTFI